ncbi:urease accessory protein UreD [Paracoccus tegillarcae]|nr:urease accessory protein UreD [Paracoccus tegillarcae]
MPHQRSIGLARIAFDGGRLTQLDQSGSAKAMLPRCHGPHPEIVFLNTSGGLTSGDRLGFQVRLGDGQRATATTQTAERAYRADGPPADARVDLEIGQGARLDWLPQETILFDGAALTRQTTVNLRADSEYLGIEIIVLGRAAMGETVTRLRLLDRRTIRRDGRLLVMDPFRLDDAALARGHGQALLGGMRAVAVLVLVCKAASDALTPLREVLDEPGVNGAASARDGLLIARCMAPDAWPLRRQMLRLIEKLRPGALPRVWQNQE